MEAQLEQNLREKLWGKLWGKLQQKLQLKWEEVAVEMGEGLVIITLHANIALRRPRQVTSSSSCAQVICGRCATDTPTRRAVCLAAS